MKDIMRVFEKLKGTQLMIENTRFANLGNLRDYVTAELKAIRDIMVEEFNIVLVIEDDFPISEVKPK